MFPLMLVLISLSLSIVVPWVIAFLLWRQRTFFPVAAPWLAWTNIFAGAEALAYMVSLISRQPQVVFWAEAALYLSAALASWAFLVGVLALWPPGRRWLRQAQLLGFLLSVPPWGWALYQIWPRLIERDYLIYNLGDYPVLRFFVHMPWHVEAALFVAPGLVFGAGLVVSLRNRSTRAWRRVPSGVIVVLVAIAATIVALHAMYLQGIRPFGAFTPMPVLEWALALTLAWLLLNRNLGLAMPLVSPDMLSHSRDIILVTDRDQRLVWWNQEAHRWFDLPERPRSNRLPHLRAVLPEAHPLWAIYQDERAQPHEVQFQHPRRGEVFVEAYTLDITGESGLRIGRALIFHDLTPWRRLQQQDAFRAESQGLARDLFAVILEQEPLEASLRRVAAHLRRPIGGLHPAAVSLWLLDDEGRRLWRAAWDGADDPPDDGVDMQPAWWRVAADAPTPAPPALLSPTARDGQRLGWAYPLRQGERPLGMLVLETDAAPAVEVHEVWRSAANTVALLITRRREAQRLHLMQQVYEHIQEAVLVFDRHGFVLDYNPAARRLFPDRDLAGAPGMEVFDLSPETQTAIQQALAERGVWLGTLENSQPNGTQRVLEIGLVQVPEVMGGLGIAVIRDVTERQRLQQELERQKAFLESLLRIGRTLLTTPLSVHATWRALLRVAQEVLEVENASFILVDDQLRVVDFFVEEEFTLPEGDYWNMVQEIIDRGFAGQALREKQLLLAQDTEHDPRWLYAETLPWRSVMALPLFYQERPLGVMTFASRHPHHFRPEHVRLLRSAADMIALAVYNARLYEEQYTLGQALLQAKEEADALRRRQEAFFANLSHEMRTPLQAILGYLEWLRMAEEGFLEFDEELRHIETAAQRLLSIVNLVLEYRRSQQEEHLVVEPFRLAAVTDEVFSLVAPLAQRNNDRLEADIRPPDLEAETDRQKVLHILLNLVSNAVKFTEDGRVTVRARLETEADREWVRLEVEDTGIGIPEEALPTIFEPFRQADDDLSRRKGGTGLGLALVRRYTELLGGRVTVHSQVGQGTTFVVRIPRRAPATPPSEA